MYAENYSNNLIVFCTTSEWSRINLYRNFKCTRCMKLSYSFLLFFFKLKKIFSYIVSNIKKYIFTNELIPRYFVIFFFKYVLGLDIWHFRIQYKITYLLPHPFVHTLFYPRLCVLRIIIENKHSSFILYTDPDTRL